MCAIFGLIDYNHTLNAKQREKLLRVLSEECEERGTDATGYAFNHNGKMTIYKRPYAAHKVHLRLHEDSNVIMGHTRMATQGNKLDNRNNHPFPGTVNGTHFALAHNGVLHNDVKLRKQMSLPSTPVKTDSYIAVQLLEQQKTLDIQSISEMAELVEGSFVFQFWTSIITCISLREIIRLHCTITKPADCMSMPAQKRYLTEH